MNVIAVDSAGDNVLAHREGKQQCIGYYTMKFKLSTCIFVPVIVK